MDLLINTKSVSMFTLVISMLRDLVFFKLHIWDTGGMSVTRYSHSDCLHAGIDGMNSDFPETLFTAFQHFHLLLDSTKLFHWIKKKIMVISNILKYLTHSTRHLDSLHLLVKHSGNSVDPFLFKGSEYTTVEAVFEGLNDHYLYIK